MSQRLSVVAQSRKWLRTPYHHNAAAMGEGVDCARLILESFVDAGIGVERFDVGQYTHDWHLHRGEEKYLEVVETYLSRVDDVELPLSERGDFSCAPADVLVWRVGRTFSHGAIVTEWPKVIHAYFPSRMVEEVSVVNTPMAFRPMRVYTYWGNRS